MSYIGIIGSKVSVAGDLISRMPPEAFGDRYIELFAGGAGVYFVKDPARRNILIELDPDFATAHQAVREQPADVSRELRLLLDDSSTFERIRALRETDEWDTLPTARRAAYLIYILKQSVNSNQQALASSAKTNSSFNPEMSLDSFSSKLQHAQIRNFSYSKAVDTYLYRSTPVEAFVFADPPYVVSDKAMHYRFNFHPVEHLRFWHKMTRLSKDNGAERNVKIMITYDDDPLIRALYRQSDGWRIEPLTIRYSSAHDPDRCRNEIVITNYVPPPSQIETDEAVDWSDVPEGASIDEVPFAELCCCDREYLALFSKGRRRSKCRVCGKSITNKGGR